MHKFGVIKVTWVLILVIRTTSVSPAHLRESDFDRSPCAHSGDGLPGSPGKCHTVIGPQYYARPFVINQAMTLKTTAARTRSQSRNRALDRRKSRLGDGCNGAYGFICKSNYSGGLTSTQPSELGPHGAVAMRFGILEDSLSEGGARVLKDKIMASTYPITNEYVNTSNGDSPTELHSKSSYSDSIPNHPVQSVSGSIGCKLAENTEFVLHGTHPAHRSLNNIKGGYGEVLMSDISSVDSFGHSGLGGLGADSSDSFGTSGNDGLGGFDINNLSTLSNDDLYVFGDIEISNTRNNNGLSTMSYEDLGKFGNGNSGPGGQFRLQPITAINTADLTGDDLTLAEQERIYKGNPRPEKSSAAPADPVSIQLAYTKLFESLQQLGHSHGTAETVKEDSLAYRPRVIPADGQQKIATKDTSERRFQILHKPVIDLIRLDTARRKPCILRQREEIELGGFKTSQRAGQQYKEISTANDNSQLPHMTYSDLDDRSTSLHGNLFVTKISKPSVLSYDGKLPSPAIGEDSGPCGRSEAFSSDYQSSPIVIPPFNSLSPPIQRQFYPIDSSVPRHESVAEQFYAGQSHLPNANEHRFPRFESNDNIRNEDKYEGISKPF